MSRPFTVQVAYMAHFANTVSVEADTLEEALEKAIAAANRTATDGRAQTIARTRTSMRSARAPVQTRGGRTRSPCPTAFPNTASRRS